MRKRYTSLVFAALSLAGCELGPNYRAPALGSLPPLSAESAPPIPEWWALYRDGGLDNAVSAARARNTDLRVADANLAAAVAAVEGARGARLPSLSLGGSANYGLGAGLIGEAAAEGRTPSPDTFVTASAGLSFDLDLFGRARRSIEAARDDAGAAAAARDQVRDTVTAATVRAYLDVCAQSAALAVGERAARITSDERVRIERLYGLGGVARFDVDRARALEAQTLASLPTIRAARRTAELEFTALQGESSERDPPECATVPQLRGGLSTGDALALLRRRGDVRQAERRLAAETARIGIAMADLYPTISLSGSAQSSAPRLDQLTAPFALTYGIGPAVTFSFPRADARARVRQARATARAALASYDGAVIQAVKEVRQALAALEAERGRRDELRMAREDRARAFTVAQARQAAGGFSYLELLQTESEFIAAEQALAGSDQAVAEDEISVFRALGSGPG